MAQYNQDTIKVYIPALTNIPIAMSPASPTIHKTPIKHKISYNACTQIQSEIDILKEEIEKTNNYCTEFKDDIKRHEHKSIHESNENGILYETMVLLKKENGS